MKEILLSLDCKWILDEDSKKVEQIIKELDMIDSNSFVFRYPSDRNDDFSKPKDFSFDIIETSKYLEYAIKFFESIDMMLRHRLDKEQEIIREMKKIFY